MARKRKELTKEDRALWDQVRKTAEPLSKPAEFQDCEEGPPRPAPKKTPHPPAKQPSKPFRIGAKAPPGTLDHDLAPSIGTSIRAQPVTMDKRRFARMTRGKLKPDARIDLHGMTLAQAHPALIDFVQAHYRRGARLILVITGKGKTKPQPGPIPTRTGVLKHQVPHWLSMAPLSIIVLQVTQAHIRHGGDGAYYVYLKKNR